MDGFLVDGDDIELSPDPPWSWKASPVRLGVNGSHNIHVDGKSVVIEPDIVAAAVRAIGQPYTSPGFDAPGSVASLVLTVNSGSLSSAATDSSVSIATRATRGTFTATMVPATNAQSVMDPIVTKSGTWSVAAVRRVSARSGRPEQATPRAHRERHWVAVELVDDDERPLARGRVAITTPDGTRYERTLNGRGATRVDGIRDAGECRVEVLHVPTPSTVFNQRVTGVPASVPNELRTRGASADGDYIFNLRSYAPFAEFGGGFEGDARVASTSPLATSRIAVRLPFNPRRGRVGTAEATSSGTRFVPTGCEGMARPRASVTREIRIEGGISVAMDVYGSNPLVAFSPDIDLHITLRATVGRGILNVEVDLSGDRFPNAEIFITDVHGQSRMVMTYETTDGPLTGPVLGLQGDRRLRMNGLCRAFPVDARGHFL